MATQGISGISATNRQFEAAFARGDAAGVAACYTDDAALLAPDLPMMTGKQAAQDYWQGGIDMGIKSVSLTTVNLDEQGDTAIDTGAAVAVIQPPGAQSMEASAKFVVIWRRQADGSWKMAVDCFNWDAPMPSG
jgi:uncharacterized protein (TIGR02246 family)